METALPKASVLIFSIPAGLSAGPEQEKRTIKKPGMKSFARNMAQKKKV
jgi:hypothetical protein